MKKNESKEHQESSTSIYSHDVSPISSCFTK